MEIRQNYENYKKVKEAFQHFIHTLVWESTDNTDYEEVTTTAYKYCNANGDQIIALVNDSVSNFVKSAQTRYKVTYYECDGSGRSTKIVDCIKTNNMELALQKAAEFYRNGMRPYVEVFDNHTNKYVVKLGL